MPQIYCFSFNHCLGEGDHVVGEVLYDFVAEGEDEISITAGESLKIAPKQRQPRIRGWLLASVDGNSKGIVPANYIKVGGYFKGILLHHGITGSICCWLPFCVRYLEEMILSSVVKQSNPLRIFEYFT